MSEAAAPRAAPPATLLERLATLVATGFGSGYSPFAPGTAGSLVGLLLFLPVRHLAPAPLILATTAVSIVGIWAGTVVARRLGLHDPSIVVVDEIAGMWVSLLLVPFSARSAGLGFLLFRAFDVWKPYPARQLEALPDGLGIMADDLMAGVYANLALRVLSLVVPLS
jgi:phosphatidylglycerophosphatase A